MDKASETATGREQQQLKSLAERARRAAESDTTPKEFRDALEDLARKLNQVAEQEGVTPEDLTAEAGDRMQGGEMQEAPADAELDEATIQAVKEAQAAAGGAGVMMMSDKDAPGSDASAGFGFGGSGSGGAEGRATELESALRQETIEASKDDGGANVDAEIRRKTEQGQATAAYTRGAAGPSDRSRATAPPPVPETRRTDVQRYFIRKQ
jgi:hypothetical protein